MKTSNQYENARVYARSVNANAVHLAVATRNRLAAAERGGRRAESGEMSANLGERITFWPLFSLTYTDCSIPCCIPAAGIANPSAPSSSGAVCVLVRLNRSTIPAPSSARSHARTMRTGTASKRELLYPGLAEALEELSTAVMSCATSTQGVPAGGTSVMLAHDAGAASAVS